MVVLLAEEYEFIFVLLHRVAAIFLMDLCLVYFFWGSIRAKVFFFRFVNNWRNYNLPLFTSPLVFFSQTIPVAKLSLSHFFVSAKLHWVKKLLRWFDFSFSEQHFRQLLIKFRRVVFLKFLKYHLTTVCSSFLFYQERFKWCLFVLFFNLTLCQMNVM